MKTMEEIIRDRMLEICEVQLRALKSALGEANRLIPSTHRAQITITITPEITVTSATVRPVVQRDWYTVWHDLPKGTN